MTCGQAAVNDMWAEAMYFRAGGGGGGGVVARGRGMEERSSFWGKEGMLGWRRNGGSGL